MNAIQKLSNNVLAYAINDFLNTDCWTEEQVAEWREEYLDRDYLPGIRTDDHGMDFPCIEGEEHSSLDFLWFVEAKYSEIRFKFDDMGLLSNFCAIFIGNKVDRVDGFIVVYNAEGQSVETVLADESWLQKIEFRIGGAEEYNAFEDFINVLWNIYGDWGWCPNLHIEINHVLGSPDWFFKS